MKKTFLTLVAVGFGMSVAFAQTTETEIEAQPQDAQMEQQDSQIEQSEAASDSETVAQDEQNRTEVEMATLPVAVQDAFKNGQYSNYEVLGIYQVEKQAEDAAEAAVYEFELAQQSEEAVNSEIEGVEVERVSDRLPEIILAIDENGQVIEEESTDEME